MGEIADMIIDGTLDYETHEVIDGESPGYPRTSHRRAKKRKNQTATFKCPLCGKRCKAQQGVEDHKRTKHSKD